MANQLKMMLNSPVIIFCALSLICGSIYLFYTPPFYIPDEPYHSFRIFQLSEGILLSECKDGTSGGQIPHDFAAAPFEIIALAVQSSQATIDPEVIAIHSKKPIRHELRYFVPFPNTTIYSPAGYLPQIVGCWVGRWLKASPVGLLMWMRLFNLIAYTVLVGLAIKWIPVMKWGVAAIALMPMSLTLASSASADPTTTMLSFLVIALILKILYMQEGPIRRLEMALICLMSMLLALSKIAYIPLLSLIIFIPAGRFGSQLRRAGFATSVFLIALVSILIWNIKAKDFFVAPSAAINPHDQLELLIHAPWRWIRPFVATYIHQGLALGEQCIGKLGWLDIALPKWLLLGHLGLLLVSSQINENNVMRIPAWHRAGFAGIFLATVTLISLMLYLSFTPVGKPIIDGLQGRYEIPILPLALLLLYNHHRHPASRPWCFALLLIAWTGLSTFVATGKIMEVCFGL